MKTRLGVKFNKETNSVEFKLASKNATNVILCIFDEPIGKIPVMNLDMKNQEGIWATSVKAYALGNLKKPIYYGFRIFGPNWERTSDFTPGSKIGFKSIIDEEGNRFNPNKIAYDPYSKELSHLPSKTNCYRVNEENFMVDNSKFAVKSVFYPENNDEEDRANFCRALKDEIIGEVHIKDLSINENIKEKGTYIGAARMAKKLKNFGFTMIEFLPLNEFDDKDNHWGYMPLSYFALSKKYSYGKEPNSALNEFKELIKAFHKEGLKVCMDVVYNHTGEARIYDNNIKDANLMSYALIDNQSYYKLRNDKKYTDNSCCKNDFNPTSEIGRGLILDSIEYFAKMGVDAFRFDLAVNLMDTNGGERAVYDKDHGLIADIERELNARGIKVNSPDVCDYGINLIAEPWTCGGENCYKLGDFPPKWSQWNDVARGTIRANSLGYETDPLGLKNLIEGTPFAFGDESLSINYVSSHDGFSLNDINSYDRKTSIEGSEYEMCNSFGGDLKAQENAIRKEIALLMISKGALMMGVGDIIAHSKGGNNNSYNLDDSTNYLDFSILNDKNSRGYRICEFTKNMIEFRKKHSVLSDRERKNQYLEPNSQITKEDNEGYWKNKNSNFLGFKTLGDDSIYCGISKDKFEIEVTLPENSEGKKWYFVCDTTGERVYPDGIKYGIQNYTIKPNSMILFVER